jgi:Skp family chaperone for outer membrane proteins
MYTGENKGKAIVLCGVLILSAFGAMAHAAEIKIGYVDMQRALNESKAGKPSRGRD